MRRLFLLVALVVILAGCGSKLTPMLAQQEVRQSAALDRAESAKVGESLLLGLDLFYYTAYAPREDGMTILSPKRFSVGELDTSQQWVAFYHLDDGSLVVEAPKSVTPDDIRLGLRIDRQGRVVGNRPWFDLSAKRRLNQPSWDGAPRLLFMLSGAYPVDVFTFDLRYSGMDSGDGLFEYREYKERGLKPAEYRTLRIGEQETFRLHGLNIRIVDVYPDHVRYVVEPVRRTNSANGQ